MTDSARSSRESGEQDATRLFLGRLFWRASTPLVASLLLGGCMNEEAAALGESAQALTLTNMNCVQTRWRPMVALKLTEPVDFVAQRSSARGVRPSFTQIDAAGRPCASAAAPRLCEAELARVSLLETEPSSTHLVFTRGDTVRALQTLEQKLSLLGAIDTPDEALLIAQHHGKAILCPAPYVSEPVDVRSRAEGGYRIALRASSGCQLEFNMFDVDRDGTLRELGRSTHGTPCPPAPPASGGAGGSSAGRRPPNLKSQREANLPASRLARYFAEVAHLEAASVPAFEQLACELRMLGAPRSLREAARRAADDEVQHARITRALAEQYGARPRAPQLTRQRLRGRSEVALDNALEGCVHETYAAYLATAQARLAHGSALAPTLSRIAADETAHAALAWQIAAWLEPQLAPDVRRNIERARAQALQGLGQRAA
jgi:hypothetical protein